MVSSQFHQGLYPMTLNPKAQYVVPVETAKVAHAIYPKGNLCITMAATLSEFLSDQDFNAIFLTRGQPAGVWQRFERNVTISL